MTKPNLLWVGDAGCSSGFAIATHHILEEVKNHFNVTVMGINYIGDPHKYDYPIYAAVPGGDFLGVGRLIWMCDVAQPDVIVIQNDPWNVPHYTKLLKRFKEYRDIPVIGIVAVDGTNCAGEGLNDLHGAIFWTDFGLNEARKGGFTKPGCVIPLGVNHDIFRPMDRQECRSRSVPSEFDDKFIVGNVNRNQYRKRWDLTLKYFASWVTSHKVKDAALMLHVAPTGDDGINVHSLAKYYGITKMLMVGDPPPRTGIPEDRMADVYNSMNVYMSTTQGEGFGLTTLEAMACKIPPVVPDAAALGDWAKGAAWLIKCSNTAVMWPGGSVLGAVADEEPFVAALHRLYIDRHAYDNNAAAAYERACEPRFTWPVVASRFTKAIQQMLSVPVTPQVVEEQEQVEA